MSTSIARIGGAASAAHAAGAAGKPASPGDFEGLFAALTAGKAPTSAEARVTDPAPPANERSTPREEASPDASLLAAMQLIGQVAITAAHTLAVTPVAVADVASGEGASAGTSPSVAPTPDVPGLRAPTAPAHEEPASTAGAPLPGTFAAAAADGSAMPARDVAAAAPPDGRQPVSSRTSDASHANDRPVASSPLPPTSPSSAPGHRSSAPSSPLPEIARESGSARETRPIRSALVSPATAMAARRAAAVAGSGMGDAQAGVVRLDVAATAPAADSLATVLALGKADSSLVRHVTESPDGPLAAAYGLAPNEGRAVAAAGNPALVPGSPAFDSAAWTAALARHVGALARGADGETSVTLDPHGLGPIEVSVRVHDSQVDVRFSILHPVTQTLVREALPALERLLGQSGMSLGQASVSQQQSDQRDAQPHTPVASRGSREDAASADANASGSPVRARHRLGLLDDFV